MLGANLIEYRLLAGTSCHVNNDNARTFGSGKRVHLSNNPKLPPVRTNELEIWTLRNRRQKLSLCVFYHLPLSFSSVQSLYTSFHTRAACRLIRRVIVLVAVALR